MVALELALLPLIFFLPGYFLVNLLFPRRKSLGGDLDPLYRAFLGILMSVSITIVYGSLLVNLARGSDQVLFKPEYLWPGLILLTVLLFFSGMHRGAYPRIRRWLRMTKPAPSVEMRERVDIFDRLTDISTRLGEARKQAASNGLGDGEVARLRRLIEDLEAEKRRLEEEAMGLW